MLSFQNASIYVLYCQVLRGMYLVTQFLGIILSRGYSIKRIWEICGMHDKTDIWCILDICKHFGWNISSSYLEDCVCNILGTNQVGHHVADILKWNFLSEIFFILRLASKSWIGHKPALIQVMAWRLTGDRPLPNPKKTQFSYHRQQASTW